MRIWYNNIVENHRYVVDVTGSRVRLGRHPDNDIVLNSPFIADHAAVLGRAEAGWELTSLGRNGCQIDERELTRGERRPVASGQVIKLYPFTLTIEIPQAARDSEETVRGALDQEMSQLLHKVHLELLVRMNLEPSAKVGGAPDERSLLTLERHVEEIAKSRGVGDPKHAALVRRIAGHCVRSELLGRLVEGSGLAGPDPWHGGDHWGRLVSVVPEREDELKATVDRVAEALGLPAAPDLGERIGRVDKGFWVQWEARARGDVAEDFLRYLALRAVKKQVKDLVFGYGPLEDLLRTPTISEIMVVDRERIYIEKNGVLENSGRRFTSDEVTEAIIQRIVARVGRQIDRSRPLVDARLSDGSRVNAVIPPLAVSGPCLTIRKFPSRRMRIDDLIARGTLGETVAEFLRATVLARRNILVSGGTGSGKTTLLNCLGDFIPDKERIVTVEDTAELQIGKEHVIRLEAREKNIEGAGAYTIRDLVRNTLRMRPDRIIVGECRGPEALDMLQAMNTGHDGSMTTIHANSAEDVVLRLQVLVQMAADLPVASINQQIASAIDVIVQLQRRSDGGRRVVQVAEVVGVDPDHGGVLTRDLFVVEDEDGREGGRLAPTGHLPSFMGELIGRGKIQLSLFYR